MPEHLTPEGVMRALLDGEKLRHDNWRELNINKAGWYVLHDCCIGGNIGLHTHDCTRDRQP